MTNINSTSWPLLEWTQKVWMWRRLKTVCSEVVLLRVFLWYSSGSSSQSECELSSAWLSSMLLLPVLCVEGLFEFVLSCSKKDSCEAEWRRRKQIVGVTRCYVRDILRIPGQDFLQLYLAVKKLETNTQATVQEFFCFCLLVCHCSPHNWLGAAQRFLFDLEDNEKLAVMFNIVWSVYQF